MTNPCHLMLDLESLGVRPGSVVLSAEFVRFDDLASCSLNLSIADQQALGLEIDPATHQWWGQQKPESWAAATQNAQPLAAGLAYFATWIDWATANRTRPLYVWCHGASFDAPLLGELYRRAGIVCPWSFRDVRDTRTLYDMAGIDLRTYSDGTDHVALGDALCQTRAAVDAIHRLKRPALRYFYHSDSDSFLFTNDGSAPDHADVQEIESAVYIKGTGAQHLTGAAA